MPVLLAALIALLLSSVAYADGVEVRSGRHEGFTRLILALPERVDFEITNDEEAANIFFSDQTLTFDTSPVFRRIGRERIADISPGTKPASLRIEFGCVCEVTSFWHEKSLLVLDIKDAETHENAAEIVPAETELLPPSVMRPRVSLKRDNIPVIEALSFPKSFSSTASSASENDKADETVPMPNVPDESGIAEARNRLLEQLSRAASQGLLAPRRDFDPREKSETSGDADKPEIDRRQVEHHPAEIIPLDHVNLQAQSSIDRDFLDTLENRARQVLGNTCLEDDFLDAGSWGTDAPFAQQVGSRRIVLMEEFDKPNQKTTLELAKLYLFFGFGEEAQQLISLMPEDTKERRVLSALAVVMQLGHAQQASILSNQLNCEGLASLWSAFSYPTLPSDTPINHKAIQKSFAALPSHLRSYLGPILSRRLLDAGLNEAADGVLRNLKRHEDTASPAAKLVDAELDLEEKNGAKALEKLDQVVGTNSEPSAEAVVTLIDTAIRSGDTVSFEHAVLAGAYLQQNRGGNLETSLARAYLVGLSSSGAFDQAYAERARLREELPPDLMAKIDSEMLDQLTLNAGDISFVRYALAEHSNSNLMIEPEVANATADKLLALGFAPQAQAFVSSETTGDVMRDRQFLRARISLAMGRPLQAEADLLNLSGENADHLRAIARNQVGDHRAATALFLSSGEQKEALRQAWLAEDWMFLENTDDDLLASAAALVSLGNVEDLEGNAVLENERVLANNRGLLQQSASTRDTLVNILQGSPSP